MVKYEKIEFDNRLPIKLICFYEDNGIIEKHWHNSIEIVVPIKGYGQAWIDGEKYEINTRGGVDSRVFIINSKSIHGFGGRHIDDLYTGFALQINYSFLKQICPQIDQFYFIQPDGEISKVIKEEVCHINEYYNYESEYKYMIIFASLYRILFIIMENLVRKKEYCLNNKSEKNKQRMLDIINYIDKHYQYDLSLDDISQHFMISKGHLSKLFRENLDVTVKGYITGVRLQHVKYDLINTDLPLIDIAITHGFPDLRSLNHSFKQRYHVTASQYRQQLKK